MKSALDRSAHDEAVGLDQASALFPAFHTIVCGANNRPALRDSDGALSYLSLANDALALSAWMQDRGVANGDRVALAGHRSKEMLTAHLAILALGAVCAPLDPTAPGALLDDQIAQLTPRLVFADANILPGCHDVKAALTEARGVSTPNLEIVRGLGGESPAYVMFTSGSTGRPKGVIIPHRAVLRLVRAQNFASFDEATVFLHASPPNFDASLLEIWAPLLNGGVCAILTDPRPSLDTIASAIEGLSVNAAWFTSGLFNLLADYQMSALERLSLLISGGDVLSPPHVERALSRLPNTRLVNGYGPTENTTFTTCFVIPKEGWGGGAVPIGAPLVGTQVHILDEAMKPVAHGDIGRLWCGGEGVALGYMGDPDLTSKKFRRDPFSSREGALLYDTGDLASLREDGALAFHGRADRQVKLNGVRVELDGLEALARCAPGVRDAAVVTRTISGDEKRLEAFVVLDDHGSVDKVRSHFVEHAPQAVTPSVIVALQQLPLTAQGKIDRAALFAPESMSGAHSGGDETERRVARIWADVLARPDVPLDQSFYALGGTSLQMLRVHARVEEMFGQMSLALLFDNPTIAAQARYLRSARNPAAKDGSQERAARARLAQSKAKARRLEGQG